MRGVVTEFIPNKRFVVHLESEINSVDVNFTLEEMESKIHLIQNVDLRFKGIMKLLSIFMRLSIKKKIMSQVQNEFSSLKTLCEQER